VQIDAEAADDVGAFIATRLPLAPVPGLPDIRLHAPGARSGLGRFTKTPPYWAYAWGGGLALARHLAAQPALVAGRRVLDFGAGSGLVGIAAAKAGAKAVLAADVDPLARAAIGLNAQANGVAVAILDNDLTAPDAPLPEADIVLAGDVFYLPKVARRVLPFLARCAAAGIPVLVGDPYRRPLPRGRLRLVAEYAVTDMGQAGSDVPATGAVFALLPQSER
jgi:predicted nicotinamide N-methyase